MERPCAATGQHSSSWNERVKSGALNLLSRCPQGICVIARWGRGHAVVATLIIIVAAYFLWRAREQHFHGVAPTRALEATKHYLPFIPLAECAQWQAAHRVRRDSEEFLLKGEVRDASRFAATVELPAQDHNPYELEIAWRLFSLPGVEGIRWWKASMPHVRAYGAFDGSDYSAQMVLLATSKGDGVVFILLVKAHCSGRTVPSRNLYYIKRSD